MKRYIGAIAIIRNVRSLAFICSFVFCFAIVYAIFYILDNKSSILTDVDQFESCVNGMIDNSKFNGDISTRHNREPIREYKDAISICQSFDSIMISKRALIEAQRQNFMSVINSIVTFIALLATFIAVTISIKSYNSTKYNDSLTVNQMKESIGVLQNQVRAYLVPESGIFKIWTDTISPDADVSININNGNYPLDARMRLR